MPDSGLNASSSLVRRLKSLDVLRAVAILLMIFSGLLPKTLPNWMDHGYNAHFLPDASGAWSLRPEVTAGDDLFKRDWPAFTWVDLVFPMFLFSMGVSVPIALSRLVVLRRSTPSIIWHVLGRWFILILFAFLVRHLDVGFMKSSVPTAGRLIVIASFLLAFLFFVRWPAGTPTTAQRTVRITAFAGMVALIIAYAVRNDNPALWSQSDTIILVLAQTYLVSSLIWLISQRNSRLRFVVLIPLILLAHYMQFDTRHLDEQATSAAAAASHSLSARQWLGTTPFLLVGPPLDVISEVLNLRSWLPGLDGSNVWNRFVAPLFDFSSLWSFTWYKYLFVVIPGTIAGDWLCAWSTRKTIGTAQFDSDTDRPKVNRLTFPAVLLLCLAVFIGLRHQGYPLMGIGGPFRTPWLALVLGLPMLAFVAFTVLPTAYGSLWISRRLCYLGASFLLVGLLLTCLPNFVSGTGYFEGGISKGPPATLSYYLVSVGLCSLLLMALTARLDYDFSYGYTDSLLSANGQNPLLAYYIAHTILGALATLSVFGLFDYPFGTEVQSMDDLALRLSELSAGKMRLEYSLPWILVAWAAAKTFVVAGIVWFFSSCRLFWRA